MPNCLSYKIWHLNVYVPSFKCNDFNNKVVVKDNGSMFYLTSFIIFTYLLQLLYNFLSVLDRSHWLNNKI